MYSAFRVFLFSLAEIRCSRTDSAVRLTLKSRWKRVIREPSRASAAEALCGRSRANLLPLLTQIKEATEPKGTMPPSRFGAGTLLLMFGFISHGSQWTFRQEQEDASR